MHRPTLSAALILAVAALLSARASLVLAESPVRTAPAEEIESLVQAAIKEGQMPGAVVAIAGPQRLFYQKAFGHRQLEPTPEPMTADTIFDLASLTKPLATGLSVMLLAERGQLSLDDPIAKHWPAFAQNEKSSITVRDCLLHRSGLIPDNRIADYQNGVDATWRNISQLSPLTTPGESFVYSDVGFLALGRVIQLVSGTTLDRYATTNLYQPLGMNYTSFCPPDAWRKRIAPTERQAASDTSQSSRNADQSSKWLRGTVHDPRARKLGGVAGHAGLFSTADDLITIGRALLACDRIPTPKDQLLSNDTFAEMIRPVPVERAEGQTPAIRGLGWDIRSPYSSNRGSKLSERAFGHGGFTGTVLWVDPDRELVFVFLSNRLHPDGRGSVNRLAGQIADLAVKLASSEQSP